jgi:8-oxo-dGTP pyrophosphatase MutT (NUDIX family)
MKMSQSENQTNWENTIARVGVVAGCVIKKDGKYLLVQEKQAKAYGLWNLPAGHVDKGETIEDAAIREAKEETGYLVNLLEKIGIFHESLDKPIKHIFTAEIRGGKLTIQEDEILDVKWCTFEEIRNLKNSDKLRAPWIWEIISKLEAA